MTKIDELAKEYAEYMCPIGDYCGGVYDEQRSHDLPIYTDDAKSAFKWLFSKPLASRLTDTEKVAIRHEYAMTYPNDIDRSPTDIVSAHLLERIFGKEFFKEK